MKNKRNVLYSTVIMPSPKIEYQALGGLWSR